MQDFTPMNEWVLVSINIMDKSLKINKACFQARDLKAKRNQNFKIKINNFAIWVLNGKTKEILLSQMKILNKNKITVSLKFTISIWTKRKPITKWKELKNWKCFHYPIKTLLWTREFIKLISTHQNQILIWVPKCICALKKTNQLHCQRKLLKRGRQKIKVWLNLEISVCNNDNYIYLFDKCIFLNFTI